MPQKVEYAITYAQIISPIIFVLGNLSCLATGPSAHPDSTLFGAEVMLALGGLIMELISRGLMLFGAIRLKRDPRTGSGLMVTGAVIAAVWILLAIVIQVVFISIVEGTGQGFAEEQTTSGVLALGCFMLPLILGELAYIVYMAFMLSDFRSKQPA